ncbi:TonB-dependent receptor plug domain-containing protein [Neptunomonas japonica]|uniref:TonB-dependent receptor n=1 Tax=Neptunomonas japonica JAMM 1380 TaxID=1441457 RepID=A0A7R6P9G2_9GAMM|nr:TonB-dependent receptor [Neptunomonas japonica]BBB29703.1 TonB-dependent receptor [Neptunomonas japonica JAMM 1380]
MLQTQRYHRWGVSFIIGLLTLVRVVEASDVDLELESLMNADVQVTSAMKRSQPISNTASSIYVLSNKDLLNAGVQSIPQALSLVPGMQVRQIDNNQWAITTRFAGGRYSSSLLVLIDGQSVYNPSFAGVYWENIDVPIQDIERIEVIRGQTGTLWGVNASNGVVNIITKNSIDTRTGYVNVTGGAEQEYNLNFRYGDSIGDQGSYRVYSHHLKGNKASQGFFPTNDTAQLNSVGMRADYAFDDDVTLFTKWNLLNSRMGQTTRRVNTATRINNSYNESVERNKIDFLVRVEERLSKNSNHMVQLSANKETGDQAYLDEEFTAVDFEYQINTLVGEHQIDMGGYYRYNDIKLDSAEYIMDFGGSNKLEHYGGFFQAQLNIVPDTFHIVLGNMSAYNDFTGWENQPSLRAIYKFSPKQTLWFNASKAARVPSYLEHNIKLQVSGSKVNDFVNTGNPLIDNYVLATYLRGNPTVEAEKTVSYEVGYRLAQENYSFDLSAYHTSSDNTLTISPTVDPHALNSVMAALLAGNTPLAVSVLQSTPVNFDLASLAALDVTGVDAVLSWDISPKLNTELSYSITKLNYDLPSGHIVAISRNSTLIQAMAKFNIMLPHNQSLNINVKSESGDTYETGDIFTADFGWRWKVKPNVMLSVNAWNLLSSDSYEYLNSNELHTSPTKVEKSVTASLYVGF